MSNPSDGEKTRLKGANGESSKPFPGRVFYLAGMHVGCVLVYVLWFVLSGNDDDAPRISDRGIVVMAAWIFHHSKRVFEFLFVHKPTTKRENIFYVLGAVVYYLGFAALIAWGNFSGSPRQHDKLPLGVFILGAVLCAIGEFVNGQHHWILRHQDRSEMPVRGLYPWLSAPHYFGELVAWLGFTLMCFTWQPLAFFVASALTVVPRAISRHKQYKAQFENFPARRKAIIPFIL